MSARDIVSIMDEMENVFLSLNNLSRAIHIVGCSIEEENCDEYLAGAVCGLADKISEDVEKLKVIWGRCRKAADIDDEKLMRQARARLADRADKPVLKRTRRRKSGPQLTVVAPTSTPA